MAACHYCRTTILFGGVKDGSLRYCDDRCWNGAAVLSYAEAVDPAEILRLTAQVHMGQCPRCEGSGPVDVHNAYVVWSLLIITQWRTEPHMCCRSCGVSRQVRATLISLVAGWWGIPWGLVLTPVQIVRNILAILRPPDPLRPSEQLERQVRLSVGANILQSVQASEASG